MTAPTIRPLTVEEFSVLRPYARGTEMSAIARTTGLSLDQVTGVIVDRTGMQRQRAAELVRQHMRVNPPAPIVKVESALMRTPEPTPAPEAVAPSSLDAILTAAEAHHNTRIRALAVKVRGLADALQVRLREFDQEQKERAAADQAREKAKARIRMLEQQLAEARAAIAKPTINQVAAAASEPQRARRWAFDNDIECAPRGRVPESVLLAYRDAYPTGEG